MRETLHAVGGVVRRLVALLPVFVALATLPIAFQSLLNAGIVNAVQAAVFGWLLLTPVSALLSWVVLDLSPSDLPWSLADGTEPISSSVGERESPHGDDPVAVLRERFARGDIDQGEFERRLDRLLATEDVPTGDDRDLSVTDDRPESRDDPAESTRSPADAGQGGDARPSGETAIRGPRDREPESS